MLSNKSIFLKLQQNYFSILSRIYNKLFKPSPLNNTNFSLISSNCVGGVYLHRKKMKFNTPTINTDFSSFDFLKFCNNLKYYLSIKPVFLKKDEKGIINVKIDDIIVKCPHSNSFAEFLDEWERRKKRVFYSNIFVIWCAREKHVPAEAIKLFDAIPYKKIFYTIDTSLAYHKNAVLVKDYLNERALPLMTMRIDTKDHRLFDKYIDIDAFIDDLGTTNYENSSNK